MSPLTIPCGGGGLTRPDVIAMGIAFEPFGKWNYETRAPILLVHLWSHRVNGDLKIEPG
jgi:hypothetical protein